MGSEATSLFPIYEAPQQVYSVPAPSDLDSTAGSEWEDASSSAHLSAISKEQLLQMLQKMRLRYHKYKGRYADVARAYGDLENENKKVKNIMQQTQVSSFSAFPWFPTSNDYTILNLVTVTLQDKALRRISELKEQCHLEQSAKRHLEEELRSDLEEKEHVITALQTKVSLLKARGDGDTVSTNAGEATGMCEEGQDLIDFASTASDAGKDDSATKTAVLEGENEKCLLITFREFGNFHFCVLCF